MFLKYLSQLTYYDLWRYIWYYTDYNPYIFLISITLICPVWSISKAIKFVDHFDPTAEIKCGNNYIFQIPIWSHVRNPVPPYQMDYQFFKKIQVFEGLQYSNI
jgi:hypothetical protein